MFYTDIGTKVIALISVRLFHHYITDINNLNFKNLHLNFKNLNFETFVDRGAAWCATAVSGGCLTCRHVGRHVGIQ